MSSLDRKIILNRECAEAEAIIREIVQQENADLQASSRPLSWDESPLKPWIINQAQTLLVFRMRKTAFLYGSVSGSGILMKRLDTKHASLIKWSAPLFVQVSMGSGGISFGSQTTSTFAVCTSTQAEDAILSPAGRRAAGMEFNINCGSRIQERADLLAADFSAGDGTVGVSKVTGSMLDLSVAGGSMSVDDKKNAAVYGTATAREILDGAVESPAEFQPLYAELSRIVNRVERPSNASPARVSASLERYSGGRDPDAVMVLPDGVVIREDLMGPPAE